MLFLIWLASIIAACVIINKKKLNAGYIFLPLLLGPLGFVILLLVPAQKSQAQAEAESLKSIDSLQDAKNELSLIKRSFSSLQSRISSLEENINKILGRGQIQVQESPTPKEEAKAPSTYKEVVSHDYEEASQGLETIEEKGKEGFEFIFGKYWLNRLGIVLFVLGVSFFIGYTFKYLNAFTKILIGYILSAAFFAWGNFLEKREKYIRISWGILGGAWGLLYLTTYAMYYIEATKIIQSPLVELWLLAIASFVAITYNLKYRSWIVTSITFLLAFITAGLGGIEYSTIIYCAFLVGSIAYLSYKLNWYIFLLLGICGTYVTYMYWLYPQIFTTFLVSRAFSLPVYQFHLSFGILLISWLLFTIALFLLKADDVNKLKYTASGVLLNGGFFIFLGLSAIYRVRPHLDIAWDVRFWFLIALTGVYFLFAYLYKRLRNPRLIIANIGIASSILAMAMMVKFPRLSVSFFWLLEMLILFIIGIYYKEIVYRVLAAILGALITFRLFIVDYGSYKYYSILGIDIKHNILIFTFAAIAFYFIGSLIKKNEIANALKREEVDVYKTGVVLGTILLAFLFGREIKDRWLALSWALEGVAILGMGFLLRYRIYRICALSVFSLACLKLIFIDMAAVNTIYKIITFIFLGAVLIGASMVYSKFMIKEK